MKTDRTNAVTNTRFQLSFHGNRNPYGMKNRMFNKYWTASFLLSIVGFTIQSLIAQNNSGLKTYSNPLDSLFSNVYHTMNIVYAANKLFFTTLLFLKSALNFPITPNTQRAS